MLPRTIAIASRGTPAGGPRPWSSDESAEIGSSLATALSRLGHVATVVTGGDDLDRVDGVDIFLVDRCSRLPGGRSSAAMTGIWHHEGPAEIDLAPLWPMLARTSFSLCQSRFQQQELERAFPGLARSTLVVPYGVDFEALEPFKSSETRTRRFLWAGNPRRGLVFLLQRIWPEIRRRFPDAELAVVRDSVRRFESQEEPDPLKPYPFCTDLIPSTPGVELIGPLTIDELRAEIARSCALLYPTFWPETSYRIALEAQALGVPVVTTDAFALRETVACAETRIGACWNTPEYVAAFVDVVALLEEAEFRARAREAGRDHVTAERYSWDAVAGRWTEEIEARFRERFERRRAGVLRRLLRVEDLAAARHLVSRAGESEVFDPLDLRELEERGSGIDDEGDFEARHLRTRPLPKLSATVIVKNEEANIRRCVESFANQVDEILIGDTGSTDRTVEVLEAMGFQRWTGEGPKPGRRIWLEIEFHDFAQARNDLAQYADGDYIFWQDADEILVRADELRKWIDDNEYYDSFMVELRCAVVDGNMPTLQPMRCFRPQTADGPLRWFGCIHETVEHEVNRPPSRVFKIPDLYVAHTGYLNEDLRLGKELGRNWDLMQKDWRENPGRIQGYIFGMRAFLNAVTWEVSTAKKMTEKAYRFLNYAYEIWYHHLRRLPEMYRKVAWHTSREPLRILAEHNLPLRLTGKIPFEVDFSFAVHAGVLDLDSRDVPRVRTFYASPAELREDFTERLDKVEQGLDLRSPWDVDQLRFEVGEADEYREFTLSPVHFGLQPF